jgi:hypothetical protein
MEIGVMATPEGEDSTSIAAAKKKIWFIAASAPPDSRSY